MIEADQCDTIDPVFEQLSEHQILGFQVVTMSCQQEGKAQVRDSVIEGLNQFGENRIVDGRHNQAKRGAATAVHRLGGSISDIPGLADRFLDPLSRRRVHQIGMVYRPRYGGRRHTGSVGHRDYIDLI